MSEILSALKKILIPIVVGLITYPVIQVIQFKGIVVKKPVLEDKNYLVYPLSCTNDTPYKGVIITFSINDTLQFINNKTRMLFTTVPEDMGWTNSSTQKSGIHDNKTRAVHISQIKQGEYVLKIPLIPRTSNNHLRADTIANIVFTQNKSNGMAAVQFTDVKRYQWYFWIYFHPWLVSFILFSVVLLFQLPTIFSKNKNEQK